MNIHKLFNAFMIVVMLGMAMGTPVIASAQEPQPNSGITIDEFQIPENVAPQCIAAAPDGNIWFGEWGGGKIGRVTPDGIITGYPTSQGNGTLYVTAGADGNIWFTEIWGKIGTITPDGSSITEYLVPTYSDFNPFSITSGPDGNIWFTNSGSAQIGRVTPTGLFTEYPVPADQPHGITTGPDGNIWFTAYGSNQIGKMTVDGTVTLYPIPTEGTGPYVIVTGPDGNLWFTELWGRNIGRITIDGEITEFPIPSDYPGYQTLGITVGADGNLWFTEPHNNKIGRITPTGEITEYPIPTENSVPLCITSAPDGKLWFTEQDGNKIGRITFGQPPAYYPSFSARLTDNEVHGYGWLLGTSVTLTIDDPSNGIGTDYTNTQTVRVADWDPNQTFVQFRLGEDNFQLESGQIVTLADGIKIKTLKVANLSVTAVDPVADTVSGTADPGAQVDIGHIYCDQNGCHGFRRMYADLISGEWIADFAHVGEDSDEQDIVDIKPGMGNEARQCDDDGDCTQYGWHVPNPLIVAFPPNGLGGDDWPLGIDVTLTIDDPETLEPVDYTDIQQPGDRPWAPDGTWISFNLQDFILRPGHIVTYSNTYTTKTVIVTGLRITEIDTVNETISGEDQPGIKLDVWVDSPHGHHSRSVIVGQDGKWSVNFSVPGPDGQSAVDIGPGAGGEAKNYDEDWDSTQVHWRVPNPYVEAAPYSGWIHAREWPFGTLVTLEIDNPADGIGAADADHNPVDYTATAPMEQAPWNPGDPNDIVADFRWPDQFAPGPGYFLTMRGGGTSKTLIISQLQVTDFDLVNDLIMGEGTTDMQIQICANVPDKCITRWVTPNASGDWTVNYHDPGTGNDDPETFDVQRGSNGWAAEYEADSDRTWYDWRVPNPNFSARVPDNEVHGYEWPLGASVTLTIDDPDTTIDYTDTQMVIPADWDATQTFVQFRLWEDGFILQPGQQVSMTGGVTTKTHLVTGLDVTNADLQTDIVSGTAQPGSRIDAWYCHENGCVNRHETAQGEEITGTVDAAQVADQFIPSILRGYNPAVQDYDYNPALARDLLTQAGYQSGFTINLWVRDIPRNYLPHAIDTAQAVQGYLNDVGITANLQVLEAGEMIERTSNGEADLFILGWIADYEHPDNFYYPHFCTGAAQFGLSTENEICSQVRAARVEADPQAQTDLYEAISQQIHDEIPVVPLVNVRTPSLFRQEVQGFAPTWSWLGAGSFLHTTVDGNVLTYAIPSAPPGLDPALYLDSRTFMVSTQVMDTLVTTESGNPVPALAESWSVSPDGLTWTFTIRSGVKFHDGTPLDAAAVLYNLERWWDPAHPYHDSSFEYFRSIFNGFKGDPDALITDISLLDSNQVQITLRELFSPMLNALALPAFAIASPAAIEAGTLNSHPVGTGPFVFVDWSSDGTIHLTANPDYWGGPPTLTDLNFQVIADEVARYGALESNAVQGMEVQDRGYVLVSQGNPALKTIWHPEMNIGYLGINQAHGPLGDLLVREAIAHAIDKQALIAQYYNEVSFGTGTWVADFANPGDEDDEQDTWDIQVGNGGDAAQCDEDGDCTQHYWQVPNYTLHVVPRHPEAHGHDWPAGAEVMLIIDNDTDPDNGVLYTRTKNADDDPWCGYPCFDLAGVFELQVGQYVTMTDGIVSKTVQVSRLTITEVDVQHDILRGRADPGSRVAVNIWSQDGLARYVTTRPDGTWEADFSVFGDEDFEQFITDITGEDNGRAIQLNPDGTDDGTLQYWPLPNNPPVADAGPDKTVAYGQDITLDASASSDPDGDTLTYDWDLDNDGQYDDASGVTITTSFDQLGDHIIGLRVTDAGGLSDDDSVTVTVLAWTLKGFYQPVDMNGVFNVVKGGSTVPFKFEIFAGSIELTDTAYIQSFTYTQTSCDTNAITDVIEMTVTGGTSLRYDAATGQFIYNWKTPYTPGNCYRVTMTTMDSSTLVTYFKLK